MSDDVEDRVFYNNQDLMYENDEDRFSDIDYDWMFEEDDTDEFTPDQLANMKADGWYDRVTECFKHRNKAEEAEATDCYGMFEQEVQFDEYAALSSLYDEHAQSEGDDQDLNPALEQHWSMKDLRTMRRVSSRRAKKKAKLKLHRVQSGDDIHMEDLGTQNTSQEEKLAKIGRIAESNNRHDLLEIDRERNTKKSRRNTKKGKRVRSFRQDRITAQLLSTLRNPCAIAEGLRDNVDDETEQLLFMFAWFGGVDGYRVIIHEGQQLVIKCRGWNDLISKKRPYSRSDTERLSFRRQGREILAERKARQEAEMKAKAEAEKRRAQDPLTFFRELMSGRS
jgi:hypothetical protein